MSVNQSLLSSYLQLHVVVLLWGFTAILGKLIDLPSLEIVFYRTLLAFVLLYVIVKIRGNELNHGSRDLAKIMGTGSIIAIHWILFFLAAQVTNVSICLAGMATTSLWTSILEPLFFKRKIKYYEPILAVIAIIGISVVFDAVIDQYLGFLIAVASAFLASVFTIINGRLVKKADHFVISFYQMVSACITIVLLMPLYVLLYPGIPLELEVTPSDAFYLLILSLVCTVYAYSIAIKLMHKLTAFAINLTVNLEPVYGIIIAVLIFQDSEHMGSSFYWGTAIILLSVLLYPVFSRYDRKSQAKEAINLN